MTSRNQQRINQLKRTAAEDAVETTRTKWLIIDGDEHTFVRASNLGITLQVIAPGTEEPIEINIIVSSEMMELDRDRTKFGFTAFFEHVGEDGIWRSKRCVGFYDVKNRRGELSVFQH